MKLGTPLAALDNTVSRPSIPSKKPTGYFLRANLIQCFVLLSLFHSISSFHVDSRVSPLRLLSRSSTLGSQNSILMLPHFPNTPFSTPITSKNKSVLHESTNANTEIERSLDMSVEGAHGEINLSRELALEEMNGASSSKTESVEVKTTPKALNAVLLAICFGFMTYTILNVDAGMTRGWSISEKAMRIPIDNWSSYESSLNTQPIATKTMINVIIYLLGDWLSQTVFVKKNVLEFDALRTLRNGFIGLVFGPIVHEYYEFSDAILPVEVGMNRLYKIFMDQTIYLGIKCSVYIVAVNVLAGESFEFSFDTAKSKIKDIMLTAWKFWPLVHCITYGAIPARHRILWVNCVDLFWNAILALKTSGSDDGIDDEGEFDEADITIAADEKDGVPSENLQLQVVNEIDEEKMEEIAEIIIEGIQPKVKVDPMPEAESNLALKSFDSMRLSNETYVYVD